MIGGVVGGLTVHWQCATEREKSLTWARFFTRSTLTRDQSKLTCDRCKGEIGKAPKK